MITTKPASLEIKLVGRLNGADIKGSQYGMFGMNKINRPYSNMVVNLKKLRGR